MIADPVRVDRRLRTALLAVLGICFMSGLGWASIPLYRMFCAATRFTRSSGSNRQPMPGWMLASKRTSTSRPTAPGAWAVRSWRTVPPQPVAAQNMR